MPELQPIEVAMRRTTLVMTIATSLALAARHPREARTPGTAST